MNGLFLILCSYQDVAFGMERDPLFDGSGLDAFVAEWKVEDPYNELRDSIWTVSEGVLHGEGGIYGWLRTKERYGDFLLHAEYQLLAPNSNTGISIRCDPYTPYGRMNPSKTGYEVQLIHGDENLSTHGPFSLYRYVAPTYYSPNPIGEWHNLKIRCEGPVIEVTHNGDKVLEFDQSDHPTLREVPQQGYIGLQTHGGGAVEFRNVWVQRLSEKLPPRPNDSLQGLSINFDRLDCFQKEWKFNPATLETADSKGWEDPDLDDSDWERVQPGEEVDGPGWYRTRFDPGTIPYRADAFLYFSHAGQKARVFLNGRELGIHDASRDGFDQRFGFRADRYLEDGTNTLAVFVEPDSDGKSLLGVSALFIERDR